MDFNRTSAIKSKCLIIGQVSFVASAAALPEVDAVVVVLALVQKYP
jgi:hypothetical protein